MEVLRLVMAIDLRAVAGSAPRRHAAAPRRRRRASQTRRRASQTRRRVRPSRATLHNLTPSHTQPRATSCRLAQNLAALAAQLAAPLAAAHAATRAGGRIEGGGAWEFLGKREISKYL